MRNIPDTYTVIPAIDTTQYFWHIISIKSFKKLDLIANVIYQNNPNNIFWVPAHKEYKRVNETSNVIRLIDKVNYPNYAFIGLYKDHYDYSAIKAELDGSPLATCLDGFVHDFEIKQAIAVAESLIVKVKKNLKFKPGTTVSLVSGLFAGMQAVIKRVKKTKVVLEITMGSRDVQIEYAITDIAEV